jgi:cell division protein FtsX
VANEPAPPVKPKRDLPENRIALVGIGALVGGAWGAIMWGITQLLGQDPGITMLPYLAVTMAMIGGGVAGIFGASTARRRGERVTPKLRRRK